MGCFCSKKDVEQPLLVPGRPYNQYLRNLWVETGGSKGIDLGVDQGPVDSVIGKYGRSMLCGRERTHPYQLVLSFPGADFSFGNVKLDGEGATAASGFEMAQEVWSWLSSPEGLGSAAAGTSHIYFDWHNLQYVPGTTAVTNYRNRGTTSHINPNWKFYYVEAQLEANCMIIMASKNWIESQYCKDEFRDLAKLVESHPNPEKAFANKELLFVLLEPDIKRSPEWPFFENKCREIDAQVIECYLASAGLDAKRRVEQHIENTLERVCNIWPAEWEPRPIIENTIKWNDATMGEDACAWPARFGA